MPHVRPHWWAAEKPDLQMNSLKHRFSTLFRMKLHICIYIWPLLDQDRWTEHWTTEVEMFLSLYDILRLCATFILCFCVLHFVFKHMPIMFKDVNCMNTWEFSLASNCMKTCVHKYNKNEPLVLQNIKLGKAQDMTVLCLTKWQQETSYPL